MCKMYNTLLHITELHYSIHLFLNMHVVVLLVELTRTKKCSWLNAVQYIKDYMHVVYIDGLVLDCSISSALALEILQSCTTPSTNRNIPMTMLPIFKRSEQAIRNITFVSCIETIHAVFCTATIYNIIYEYSVLADYL